MILFHWCINCMTYVSNCYFWLKCEQMSLYIRTNDITTE